MNRRESLPERHQRTPATIAGHRCSFVRILEAAGIEPSAVLAQGAHGIGSSAHLTSPGCQAEAQEHRFARRCLPIGALRQRMARKNAFVARVRGAGAAAFELGRRPRLFIWQRAIARERGGLCMGDPQCSAAVARGLSLCLGGWS